MFEDEAARRREAAPAAAAGEPRSAALPGDGEEPPGGSLATLAPGPGLAARLDAAASSSLADAELVDSIVGWEQLAAWAQARQLQAIAEFATRRPAEPAAGARPAGFDRAGAVSEFAADEVAFALRLSRTGAQRRLHLALDLVTRLPATLAALRGGDLDLSKTRAVADATAALPADAAAAVQAAVLPHAGAGTIGQLRARLDRALLTVDPAAAHPRHRAAAAARRVEVHPQPDAMAALWVYGPADTVTGVYTTLDAHARAAKTPGDTRGVDARRFDALTDLVLAATSTRPGPTAAAPSAAGAAATAGPPRRPAPVRVQVTVPAATLLGLSHTPGELAGYGPIPAEMARRLAADATWTRLLTDPATGALLDAGTTTYRPPAALAAHVRARDQTCRAPGCRAPAARCDLDHTVPYPHGPTAARN